MSLNLARAKLINSIFYEILNLRNLLLKVLFTSHETKNLFTAKRQVQDKI